MNNTILHHFSSTTLGREKIMRLVQYFLWFLNNVKKNSKLGSKAIEISAHLGLVRRVLRFGAPLGTILAMVQRKYNTAQALIQTIGDLAILEYYPIDHLEYPIKLGISSTVIGKRIG